MLTRVRIEVEGYGSAQATVDALSKYEHALQVVEVERYSIVVPVPGAASAWEVPAGDRNFFNDALGREITDEVIEFDAGLPGYRGRRVVQFRRVDTRQRSA